MDSSRNGQSFSYNSLSGGITGQPEFLGLVLPVYTHPAVAPLQGVQEYTVFKAPAKRPAGLQGKNKPVNYFLPKIPDI